MSTAPQDPRQEAAFFTMIRDWGVVRGDDGVIGGVAQGVGTRIGMDRLPARIIVVVIGIVLTPIALLGYAAAWALLPDSRGNIIIQDFGRGRPNVGALIGIGVMGLIGLTSSDSSPWFMQHNNGWGFGFSGLWALVAVGAVVAFIIWLINRNRDDGGPQALRPEAGGTPPVYAAVPPESVVAEPADADEADGAQDGTDDASPAATASARRTTSATASAAAEAERPTTVRTATAAQPRPVKPRPWTPGPGRAIYLLLLAATFTVAALVWWLERESRLEVGPAAAFFAVLVIIVGAGIVIAGAAGRRVGFLGFAATVLFIGWTIALLVPGASAWLDDRVNLTFSGEPIVEATLSDDELADRAFRCAAYDEAAADAVREATTVRNVDATDAGANIFVDDRLTVITVAEGASIEFDVENSLNSGVVLWEEAGVTCDLDFGEDPLTIGNGRTDVRVVVSHSSATIVIEED